MDLKPTRKKAMLHRMCFTQNKNIRHLSRMHGRTWKEFTYQIHRVCFLGTIVILWLDIEGFWGQLNQIQSTLFFLRSAHMSLLYGHFPHRPLRWPALGSLWCRYSVLPSIWTLPIPRIEILLIKIKIFSIDLWLHGIWFGCTKMCPTSLWFFICHWKWRCIYLVDIWW